MRPIKIHSMTSFGEEVKLSVPCREVLQNVKDTYGYNTCGQNLRLFLAKYLPDSLLGVCWYEYLPETYGGLIGNGKN
jgi:hypothetical protein